MLKQRGCANLACRQNGLEIMQCYSWTDEELERLRKLRAEGLSQQAIGEALGRTKGVISTKLRDLGLNKPPPPRAHASHARENHTRIRAGKVTLPPLGSLSDC